MKSILNALHSFASAVFDIVNEHFDWFWGGSITLYLIVFGFPKP